jgi:hypothetical protein
LDYLAKKPRPSISLLTAAKERSCSIYKSYRISSKLSHCCDVAFFCTSAPWSCEESIFGLCGCFQRYCYHSTLSSSSQLRSGPTLLAPNISHKQLSTTSGGRGEREQNSSLPAGLQYYRVHLGPISDSRARSQRARLEHELAVANSKESTRQSDIRFVLLPHWVWRPKSLGDGGTFDARLCTSAQPQCTSLIT